MPTQNEPSTLRVGIDHATNLIAEAMASWLNQLRDACAAHILKRPRGVFFSGPLFIR